MFEPDEFLFSKVAKFLKNRKKNAKEAIKQAVKLDDIKPRLTLLARAITGHPIEIFQAEREGGYKDNSFFLPVRFAEFDEDEKNTMFYLFRVLYLCEQKRLDYNYVAQEEFTLQEAQDNSFKSSEVILQEVFSQFPSARQIHADLITLFDDKASEKNPVDYTFIYGKWMRNDPEI